MYKLLLCFKYLRTRYIALASIISVMLGVATMIVVNSVMAGFGGQMKDRIRGIMSDVVVESRSYDGAPDPEGIMRQIDRVAGDKIEAITPTVTTFAIMNISIGGMLEPRPITLVGIYPEEKDKVSALTPSLMKYQEIIEGDQIIRGPLRTAGQAPNWELEPEEMQRRVARAEQNSWRPETVYSKSQETNNEAVPDFDEDAVPEFDEEFDSTNASEEIVAESETDPLSNLESSFNEYNVIDEQPVEPGALMKARVYVGSGLASYKEPQTDKRHWLVRPGDDVVMLTNTIGMPKQNPVSFSATVVDIFHCGMSEYDSNLVFMNIEALQEYKKMLLPEAELVTSFQIKLKNYDDSEEVVNILKANLPPGTFEVTTWEDRQGALLQALAMEAAILNVLLSLIIAVAGFGILAIFFMIVVEKTRDIGILKSLGASSRGVMSIFLGYGFSLGIVGSGVGVMLGLAFVVYINEISDFISKLTGQKIFDDQIYYFDKIPTEISPYMVFWVSLGAITIAVLASVLPARRAANLNPVEALRHQ
ncbi:Lipoprotein-releasing system transmembrane protein LolE [Polystyrenella longa]|uniref:Lipoprotein-releasing system transmembrane protein LolE n=1 Tax=Polystyrenella longa TaxID=2528007 RepID=A0A518CUF2_9PLAN|nr:ABC transporter permease [Polystyrenella longa]QDU82845.1 Lipoprotein-releasing system transmembrane protein LolE [Polystyrenella longa]